MSINASTILGGPAIVTYRGASFYSQGNIEVSLSKETFPIAVDRYGKVDERVSDEQIRVSFTPAGEWENLSVLWPYASTILGSLITPQSQSATINTGTDVLTASAHGFTTEDDVLISMSPGGTIPTATPTLTQTTRYYVKRIDADTFTLHPTAADATAGTNTINFSDDGTGTVYINRDFPLVIHTFAGRKLTLYNAAVTQMPAISLGATKTLIGQVEFEGFLRNGCDWSTSAARYAIEDAALSDTTFAPSSILTQPYTAAWGSTAPWNSFATKEGFEVAFSLSLEPVMTDSLGVVSRRLAGIDVSCRAQPLGISEEQLLTKLLLQDTGAIRGRSLSGDNLLISGTGVYVQLYGAALRGGPLQHSVSLERVGSLEWVATRTFATGTPNPLFYVGTTTP